MDEDGEDEGNVEEDKGNVEKDMAEEMDKIILLIIIIIIIKNF